MQNALGIAGGSGGVDGISRIVVVNGLVTGLWIGLHDLFPGVGVQLKFAAAVLADVVDTLGCVGVLHQRPGSACLPDAEHGDHRHDASGQVDQHKVLFADAVIGKIGIDPAAHVVELRIGDTLCVCLVKQNGGVGVFLCILFQ